ncbi:4-aminobutyrate--2-oxoglutarate transaminase [Alicyclobacillus shizuokensis]|uniref:4-aminobutyrate--2-oxoglutarate transaminase n=1 Tax=Alicyclobacillus shizuokensis TaxID=392014 RepID=UPI00082AB039|nr:4-aminobutyrate--2-oxoglutarate transaminase [Alicyclobacillus shizuokensis]
MSVSGSTPVKTDAPAEASYRRYIPNGVSVQNPVCIVRGEGARMWDDAGNEYLDFAGGIGCLNIGSAHPEVVQVVQEQAAKLFHTCVHVTLNQPYLELAKKLCEITPITGSKKALLLNSGAEAVENAVKVARSYTGRSAVIAFEQAFHGRTNFTLALTSKVHPYKAGFGPFVPEVYRLPYPNPYRRPEGQSEEEFVDESVAMVKRAFDMYVDANNVAAVILEPVQGEGGFIVPPAAFLYELRRLCREHGIVFIVDEVQTGFARTGRLFATEHYPGLNPDVITMAKSMGAGLPISAVVGRAEILDSTEVGGLGGTYGGNPVAAAAALKVIEIMERDDLPARARRIGEISMARLRELQREVPYIGEVRGQGAMVAVEFVRGADKAPYPELVAEISRRCLEERLLTIKAGVYNNVIRMLSPLVIQDEELVDGLDRLKRAILGAVRALHG